MKTLAMDQPGSTSSAADPPSQRVTKRRGLLIGVGAAGAAVIAAKALPGAPAQVAAAPAKPNQPAPDTSAGYRLSQHVLRYYETTKV